MTILYHGGDSIIESPEIRIPNRTLDFGSGFYLTSSSNQAKDWVHRKLEYSNFDKGFVNEYTFDSKESARFLKIKEFKRADEEWLDFVMANRRIPGFTHDYDIVIGPVANDRVYTAFALYEGGAISKDILIAELKTYRLVDQFLFHSENALRYLKFKDAKEVKL